jgi:hypothetical protein
MRMAWISWTPFATTVTRPPPATPSTMRSLRSPWTRARSSFIRFACDINDCGSKFFMRRFLV